MKRYILIIGGLLLCLTAMASSKENIKLRFDRKGQFKIAQFTDIHWDNKSPNCSKTVEVIKSVLSTEKPDLAMLTGDIVTDAPAKDGWLAIAKIFEEAAIPWAVILGNHDAETGVTREEIFDIIEDLPYFVGEKGPELTGCGNYTLPILGSNNDKTSAVLYCLDTNNKPPAHKYGHYDWIHFDQIQWYRQMSDNFTARNNNIPLPALTFIHIPLLEYKLVEGRETTIGNDLEGVASADINSGAFCSMVEKKDVMGIFAGHDHDNDYIGMEQDIALAFGRTSGVDAYGKLERGSRIILMYEDKFKFDTWIRTSKGTEFEYYYPSGLSSVDEESMNYLPAKNIKVKQPGVKYTYYEGRFRSTDELANAKPLKTGILKNISIAPATAQDSMAFRFKTWIRIPETGVYKFYTYSDDGSRVFIDGQLVVDNDGSHSARRKDGKIALKEGFHEMEILYFESYMGEVLEVGYSSRNIREEILPDNILFIAE